MVLKRITKSAYLHRDVQACIPRQRTRNIVDCGLNDLGAPADFMALGQRLEHGLIMVSKTGRFAQIPVSGIENENAGFGFKCRGSCCPSEKRNDF